MERGSFKFFTMIIRPTFIFEWRDQDVMSLVKCYLAVLPVVVFYKAGFCIQTMALGENAKHNFREIGHNNCRDVCLFFLNFIVISFTSLPLKIDSFITIIPSFPGKGFGC